MIRRRPSITGSFMFFVSILYSTTVLVRHLKSTVSHILGGMTGMGRHNTFGREITPRLTLVSAVSMATVWKL